MLNLNLHQKQILLAIKMTQGARKRYMKQECITSIRTINKELLCRTTKRSLYECTVTYEEGGDMKFKFEHIYNSNMNHFYFGVKM